MRTLLISQLARKHLETMLELAKSTIDLHLRFHAIGLLHFAITDSVAICADILSVIPNEAKQVHSLLFDLLQDRNIACVKMSLSLLVPLVMNQVIKIGIVLRRILANSSVEGNIHHLAECLVSTDASVVSTCTLFFRKYFLNAKKSLPKTVFQIFCSLGRNDRRRDIISIILNEFCATENEVSISGREINILQNLSSIFITSLRESVDVDKLFVISLLKPSKKSLEDLKTLLNTVTVDSKGNKQKESNLETPLERLVIRNEDARSFLREFLSNANNGMPFRVGSSLITPGSLKEEALAMIDKLSVIAQDHKKKNRELSKRQTEKSAGIGDGMIPFAPLLPPQCSLLIISINSRKEWTSWTSWKTEINQ